MTTTDGEMMTDSAVHRSVALHLAVLHLAVSDISAEVSAVDTVQATVLDTAVDTVLDTVWATDLATDLATAKEWHRLHTFQFQLHQRPPEVLACQSVSLHNYDRIIVE
jgi:hypothetical protein